MITLYGRTLSRAARSLWTLEEIGVKYQHLPYDFEKGETATPEYLAINPAGKIPALTDGDVVLGESLAINLYLAQTYAAGSLWPDAAARRARCLQWSLWAATELEPVGISRLVELGQKGYQDTAAAREAFASQAAKPLNVLAAILSKQAYLTGTDFTVADINVAVVMDYFVRAKCDFGPWPAVKDWHDRCAARPANQRVTAMRAAAARA